MPIEMIFNQLWKLIVDHINDHFTNAYQRLIVCQISSHQVIERYKCLSATNRLSNLPSRTNCLSNLPSRTNRLSNLPSRTNCLSNLPSSYRTKATTLQLYIS